MRRVFSFLPLLAIGAVGVLGLSGQLDRLGGAQQVASSSYEASKVTLKDGSEHLVRWDGCQDAITYAVDLKGEKTAERRATLRTIKASFAALSKINGLTYRYTGQTDFVPTTGNMADAPAEIVVAAVRPTRTDFTFEGDTLGVGGVLWNSWKDSEGVYRVAAVRGYVILNSTTLPALKNGSGKGETVGNLVEHELGHVMGLEHVLSSNNLMNAELSKSTPAGYGPGDERGLKALGATVECLDIPVSALPDL